MHFASSSLVMESWARKASSSRARPAPLTFCATGRQNSPSMKVTGGWRRAHSWCECRGQRRGCSEPSGCAHRCDSRAATGHAQHSCTVLNSITQILSTCSHHLLCDKAWIFLASVQPSGWCHGLWISLAVILCKLSDLSYRYLLRMINATGLTSNQDTFLLLVPAGGLPPQVIYSVRQY